MEPENTPEDSFKKPVFVAKAARLSKKAFQNSTSEPNEEIKEEKEPVGTKTDSDQNISQSKTSCYQEPKWSGLPNSSDKPYAFEVLKNGSIIENINLMEKPFHVIGRLVANDICMQHPTVSRHHAVVQYRSEPTEAEGVGFYVYDVGSTHGTFLNKMRLKPKVYARIRVGHVLKLGCSSRMFILAGPEEDAETESELTVTELKQQRLEELQRRDEIIAEKEKQEELRLKKIEEAGVDWGMGEDAEDELDLSENPFAQTNNEELYLDNPKNTLRGFFEREGLDLDYDCKEQGIGQFFCRIELPLDDEMGKPVYAEVTHKGKKKEAVVQCALEACRILDRHGVLRQSTHESRKRKPKNWEENDYYDSDDDTFLDRTGTVEKKREKRMQAKQPQKAETYECLLSKEKEISAKIHELERKLSEAEEKLNAETKEAESEIDSLDSYMMELKDQKPDKQTVKKLKLDIINLQKEHKNLVKLVNIAKPASLPALVVNASASTSASLVKNSFPLFGKRKKTKFVLPASSAARTEETEGYEDEEMEQEEKSEEKVLKTESESSETIHERFLKTIKETINNKTYKNLKMKLIEVDHKIDNAASDGVDLKAFQYQEKKVLELLSESDNEKDILKGLDELIDEIKLAKPKPVPPKVKETKKKMLPAGETQAKNIPKKEIEVRKKSEGRKRRKGKNHVTDYENKDDYSTWVPPTGQSGDGRTSLNDKLGY